MWLAKFQSFESKEAMNQAVKEHLQLQHVTDTERKVFELISRYAVKFPGAAHLKVATILKELTCSDKTVRRMLNRLAEKGMIQKVYTIRDVRGGKGANILVILPVKKEQPSSLTLIDQSLMSSRPTTETQDTSSVQPTKMKTEPSFSFKQKPTHHIKDTAVPANALAKKIPPSIFHAFSLYFSGNAEAIYSYYGILLRAKASIASSIRLEDHAEPFIEAWHSTILQAKRGKIQSMDRYLYRAFQQAARTIVRQSNPLFNWLEC